MNSSSAISNVLSASQVQPASNPPTGRSLTDNGDSPGFKSAFAEVRAEQEVKPKKLAADKPAKAKSAPDNAADAAPVNQKPSAPAKKITKGEEKDPQDAAAICADETEKSSSLDPLLALDMPVIAQVPTEAHVAVAAPTLNGEPEVVGENSDASVLEAALAILPVDATATLELMPASAEQNLDLSTVTTTEDPSIIAMAEVVSDKTLSPVLTAVTPAAAIAETITAAGLTPLKSAETKLSATSPDAPVTDAENADALLLSDDQLASKDPKAVFEKMLQTIASNATTSGNAGSESQKALDLAATLAALAPAVDGAAAPGIESLSRSPEAQLPYARNFVVQTAVPVNVGQPGWSQAVGEKVLWLAAQNVQSAEIRLDPPELGPMMVKVSVHQEQTSISFTSHNAGVRELIEQNQARLREMFSEQGLNLVNVDVSDKSFQRHQSDGGDQQGQGARSEQEEEESLQAVSTIVQQRLVDHYA